MCADKILVADSSRARLFTVASWNEPLQETADFVHSGSRAAGRELLTDQPGRSFDSVGGGRHAMEPDIPVKQLEAMKFSREVATYLNQECSRGGIGHLYLIAAPEFLGLLRGQLSKQARLLVVREVAKNLVLKGERVIRDHLRLH